MTKTLFRCVAIALAMSLPMACAAFPIPREVPLVTASARDTSIADFIAAQRVEARRLEGVAEFSQARRRWLYIVALAPGDGEGQAEIARLDRLIGMRVAESLAEGEMEMRRGRAPAAQQAFLRVLALDGANEQARRRLRELDTNIAFARQQRRNEQAAAARLAGTEGPENEQ